MEYLKKVLKIAFPILRPVKRKLFGPFPFSRIEMYKSLKEMLSDRKIAGNILEIGGIRTSLKRFLQPWGHYVTINIDNSGLVRMNGECLGFKSEVFDNVLIDQTIEHVEAPLEMLKESWRVLKPGGRIIVTSPMMMQIHGAPDDYWRFTEGGLKIVLAKAGFHDIRTDSWGNQRSVIAHMKYSWFGTWNRLELKRILNGKDKRFPLMCWAIGDK